METYSLTVSLASPVEIEARIALRSPSGGLGGSAPRPQVEDETWTVLAIGPDVSARVDAVTGGHLGLTQWLEPLVQTP